MVLIFEMKAQWAFEEFLIFETEYINNNNIIKKIKVWWKL